MTEYLTNYDLLFVTFKFQLCIVNLPNTYAGPIFWHFHLIILTISHSPYKGIETKEIFLIFNHFFGYPKANFEPLMRRQPHLPDNHSTYLCWSRGYQEPHVEFGSQSLAEYVCEIWIRNLPNLRWTTIRMCHSFQMNHTPIV